MKKTILLILLLLGLAAAANAATKYLWPLPYGRELTSIFGSSRTRRYHAGVDIRTGGVIGKKVVAPADGYIIRVRASYYGYGKAIYLRMKDGNTAVFGHLSRYTPEVEEYVRQQQIASETYKQDLYPPENKFKFKRGQLIGFSGSTGVGAPHLHFEIRSPENVPLNPLKFKGLEVYDKSAPHFKKLRLMGFGNDELAEALGWRIIQPFKRARNGVYHLSAKLPCGGQPYWVSAEVVDWVSHNHFDKPTYSVNVEQGRDTIYALAYDALPFEESYRVEVDRNFQEAELGDDYFYNFLPRGAASDPLKAGICAAIPDLGKPLEIRARDVAGNHSRAEITFYADSALSGNFPVLKPDYKKLQRLLTEAGYMDTALVASLIPAGEELYLLLESEAKEPQLISVSCGDPATTRPQDVQDLGHGYYLVRVTDLVRNVESAPSVVLTIIQQSATGGVRYSEVPCTYRFPWGSHPGKEGKLVSEDGRLTVLFPPLASMFYPFDTHYFFRIDTLQSPEGVTYALFPNDMPLANQVTYRYDADNALPPGAGLYADADTQFYYLDSDRSADGRSLKLKSYTLGRLVVRNDDVPPTIREVRPKRGAMLANARPKVSCDVRDEMSGIGEDIEIRIDGRWIVPVYDFETHRVNAEAYFDLEPGNHKLQIKATDNAGNTRIYDGDFSVSGKK